MTNSMPGSPAFALAFLLLFVIIPVSSAVIVYYFVRRYMRIKLQRKDLGFKGDLIVTASRVSTIIIIYALWYIIPQLLVMMNK